MTTLIHCPGCNSRLNIPVDAGGRRARCPVCMQEFIVPNPRAILDDTVTCWLDLDHIHEEEELDEMIDARHSEANHHDDASTQVGQDAELEPETSAQPEPVEAAPPPPTDSPDPDTPKVTTGTGGSFVVERVPDEGIAAPVAPRTPVDPNRIALQVMDVGTFGVRFRFPARLLDNANFRASMPMRGMLSAERDRTKLIARPLAWIDKATGHLTNTGELEARYEVRPRSAQSPREVVAAMATIEELPPPFNQPMPYYVMTEESSSVKVHCETFATPGGVQCEVTVPSLRYAMDWLGRVNGVCGDDYAAIEAQTLKYEAEAWRTIPAAVRHRLAVWFDFEGDERFLGYFNDSDFSKSDAGLAGLILTSRRIVWCKYHHHGSTNLEEPGQIIATEDGNFANLCLDAGGHLRKLVRMRGDDVKTLANLLDDIGGAIRIEFRDAEQTSDVQAAD